MIEVRSGETFLDIIIHQISYLNQAANTMIPLVLMNSFNTHKETKKIVKKYSKSGVEIINFCQSEYPRIYSQNFMPVPTSLTKKVHDEW